MMYLPLVTIFFSLLAQAESLDALVKREEGILVGECLLSPSPKLKADKIFTVVPARFEDPVEWTTKVILLVGVNKENVVQGTVELNIADKISPKTIVDITCDKSILTIREPRAKFRYKWTGTQLTRLK